MSERKSWDVQPSRKAGASRASQPSQPAASAPQRTREPQPASQPRRRAEPSPVRKLPVAKKEEPATRAPQTATRTVRRPAQMPAGTLKERRKKKQRTARYVFLVISLLLVAAAFYAVWMPALRITSVEAQGPNSETAEAVARMQLSGTYGYVLPRNSILFIPDERIRAAVLDALPEVSALSINRTSFSSIAIGTTPRAAAFLWCGTTADMPVVDGSCYDADVEGLIFMRHGGPAAPPETAPEQSQESTDASSTSQTPAVPALPATPATDVNGSTTPAKSAQNGQVRVFAALDTPLEDGQSPVRRHIVGATRLMEALKFVDAMRQLDAPVSSIEIKGDEATLWLQSRTRIMYVLGDEQDAAQLAASALPTLNLTDGSVQYVDLRFAGKAYVQKYGQSPTAE